MNRFLHALSAPARLCRRFHRCCEEPGRIETAIRVCDQVLPMIAVTVASVLIGCSLALCIAAVAALWRQ